MEIPIWAQMEIIKRKIAIAEARKAQRERLQENAEYQRRHGMTDTQRGVLAVDRMTEKRLQFERSIKGEGVTEEEVRRKVLAMQNKFERQKK